MITTKQQTVYVVNGTEFTCKFQAQRYEAEIFLRDNLPLDSGHVEAKDYVVDFAQEIFSLLSSHLENLHNINKRENALDQFWNYNFVPCQQIVSFDDLMERLKSLLINKDNKIAGIKMVREHFLFNGERPDLIDCKNFVERMMEDLRC